MTHEFQHTLENGLIVNVEYGVIDDGEDVKVQTVTPLGMPQCLAVVSDEEMENIAAAALEHWFFL